MSEDGKFPYKNLGKKLKSLRESTRQSLIEVSGAVEIDSEKLEKIELGSERPSEDILLLLISHFGLKSEEANRLFALANYQKQERHNIDTKQGVMVMQNDARVIYSDLLHVTANKFGFVVNFMQESGPAGQPLIVSRIGMSREHAQSVVEVLSKILQVSTPKALPGPKSRKDKPNRKKPNA